MKIFSVCGISKSGKTTTIEWIIRELKRRKYKVGSVKEIHNQDFAIDPLPSSNTNRHRLAGAGLVTARGHFETDVLYQEKLSMERIIEFYRDDFDYLVLEGVDDIPIPTIVTAHEDEDAEGKWSDYTFCLSGRLSEKTESYRGKPAISALENITKLVDLIEAKVYERLPNFPPQCCTACGYDCATLGKEILAGNANRNQCVADKGAKLVIDGRAIDMVPFVQDILRDTVLGLVKNLDGYRPGAKVEIEL